MQKVVNWSGKTVLLVSEDSHTTPVPVTPSRKPEQAGSRKRAARKTKQQAQEDSELIKKIKLSETYSRNPRQEKHLASLNKGIGRSVLYMNIIVYYMYFEFSVKYTLN